MQLDSASISTSRQPQRLVVMLGEACRLLLAAVAVLRTMFRCASASPCALILVLSTGGLARAGDVTIVRTSDAEPYVQAEEALRAALAAEGHRVRSVPAKEAAGKGLEAALGRPDMVVAVGTPAASWLHKELPKEILLGYCMVTNAEAAGLTAGRQAAGVTTDVPMAAQFRLISEALPRVRSVGMLYRSDTPDGQLQLKRARESLPSGWSLEAIAINEQPSVSDAIETLMKRRIDLVSTFADPNVYDAACVRALLLAALRNKVPVWGFSPSFVRAGAVLGTGVDPRSQGTQAAGLVARMLKDPKASDERALPPDPFQVAVNLIVAGQLDVTIPESLVRRASHVFRPEK